MRVVVGGVTRGNRVGAHRRRGLSDRAQVGDWVVAGLELRLVEHFPAVEQVATVQVAGQPHAAAIHGDDRTGLEYVCPGMRQPHRELDR